jgi:2'-hydroxyisoflavone reductase
MRLLLLGGPKFVGRALIEAALERGHEVTTFNRGQTNAGSFAEVEELHGDRAGDLAPLRGRSWDAVLDTSAYVPQVVRSAASLLADSVERYCFVSSISVYADYSRPIPEDAPLEQLADGHPDDELLPDYANYGPLKVLCERAAEERFPGRTLIVRPGLIVGPNDPTDRFTYWARRAERGGAILAPPADTPVQVIDVRDLAGWMVGMVERGETGAYNAVTPPGVHTFRSMLEACGARDVAWVDEAWLLAEGVEPWRDLPVWIPAGDPDMRWFQRADVSRAVGAGLTFRPLAQTARDTPDWTGGAGLTPEREAELLAAWRKKAA